MCKDCNKAFCGSFLTKECGQGDVLAPNTEIKNFKGAPIPTKLYEQLEEVDKKMREGKKKSPGALMATWMGASDEWGGPLELCDYFDD